jgi:beta-glucosidase
MRFKSSYKAAEFATLSASILFFSSCAAIPQKQTAAPEDFARHLVAKMTLDEKIAEVHGIRDEQQFRYVPGIPRLGIPGWQITNGPAGVGPGGTEPQPRATALPAPISLAASWDPELARQYGELAGHEAQALGSDLLEAPDINIIRVPQSGRAFESFSEDPYLVSRLAVASIQGTQSTRVLANVKHYLANNQEQGRRTINEVIDERPLREIYMPGFEASVHEGEVASVMSAYPQVNGAFMSENGPLLDVLKKEWGFKGFVFSDFGAVHSTIPSALNGLDLEMPTGIYFGDALKAAVEQGQVPESRLDDMLVRRYAAMVRFGLFDAPQKRPAISPLEDGALSRQMAEQGMVLLKNRDHVLPLDSSKISTALLVGPMAVRPKTGGGGSSHVIPFYSIQPVDGFTAHMRLHPNVDVLDGHDIEMAVAAAKKAQVVVVMVGDDEAEGHDHPITLPADQDALIEAVAKANPHTIVVLKSGSAILMPWVDSVAAVLVAWYPGQEDGNAVADILFGDAVPSGKLPITFPASVEDTVARDPLLYPGDGKTVRYQEGLEVGYRWYQAHDVKPLFPFGFGLSYTSFNYSDFSVRSTGKHRVEVRCKITNTGMVRGGEVAQVYVGFPHIPEGDEPPLQLKQFEKVWVSPGESGDVALTLDERAFSYWSVQDHAWKVQPGTYVIRVGSSSADLPLGAKVEIQ